jgi:hypothetical protein
MGLAPRIARQRGTDGLLRLGLDDVHDPVVVAERAAEHDEPLIDEGVHEGCVGRPA